MSKVKVRIPQNRIVSREEQIKLFITAMLSGEKHKHDLEQLKFTAAYDKEGKNKINLALNYLMRREKVFNNFVNEKEEAAIAVHNIFYDYLKEMVPVSFEEVGELTQVVKAFRKDKKSILGITKKILK